MTHKNNNISDADLHAFVDGELDQQRREQIERYLSDNPEKAHEIADWQRQAETLQALYGNIADEPVPVRLDPNVIAQKVRTPRYGRRSIAAMLALFAIGGASGWFGHGVIGNKQILVVTQTPMVRQALTAHAVYSVEVSHPVEVGAEQEDHLVKWLSKRLSAPITAPKLNSNGFSLIGGRLLPGDEGAAAQFMYEDSQGARITLYLVRNREQKASAFRFASYEGMNSFYWHDDHVGYALVGDITRDRLSALSHEIYSQLDN
jgi:anti-sigma factor RsiW